VGTDGWRIMTHPPVRFLRAAGMLPLPVPERGGSIETLASFSQSSNTRRSGPGGLLVARSTAALRPISVAGNRRRNRAPQRQSCRRYCER
jgi:hypothetical protein